jgi:hypothetical protein
MASVVVSPATTRKAAVSTEKLSMGASRKPSENMGQSAMYLRIGQVVLTLPEMCFKSVPSDLKSDLNQASF